MSERITFNTLAEWDALTPEQKRAFVEQSVEDSYRNEYEAVRQRAPDFGRPIPPPWDELTEEQRENVRSERRRYAREMQALGEAIRKGAAP